MKNSFSKRKKTNSKKNTKAAPKNKKQVSIPVPGFKKLTRERLIIDLIIVACVVLVGITAWVWWSKILMDPNRVLSDTLANNLRTRSITKSVDQSGVTGGINQVSYVSFYPSAPVSKTNTVLTQGVGSNATSVSTETIGTPQFDFVRYTAYKAGSGFAGADRLNGLLGKWAKRQQDPSKGQEVTFLDESLFGIFPYGYLNEGQRTQLLDTINQKNIYKYTAANRMMENRRPVYVYDMSINPADLVSVIRDYVKLTGANDSSQLDPLQYQGLGDVKVKVTIDILSRQITQIQYSTGRTENYSGQNLYQPIDLPAGTIPVEELQRRLQGASA